MNEQPEELKRQIVNLKERLRMVEIANSTIQNGVSVTVNAAVAKERKRCADIVQAARAGDIDQDFRSIIYRIESGGPLDDQEPS